jgi:hypothetical protein
MEIGVAGQERGLMAPGDRGYAEHMIALLVEETSAAAQSLGPSGRDA